MFNQYDVIVVGAGHAGCEAAAAAANMKKSVLLITMNMQTIAQMSCNPAMGGIAKGQIVREIDAMGGYSAIVSDKSRIQFRMLNKSKGPAMWSPRTQNDRMLFAQYWRTMLEQTPYIDFWQEMVTGLIVKNGQVKGVRTSMGIDILSKTVILTNGTFLNGCIHIGEKKFGGGRAGEKPSKGITKQLIDLGFESGRMKTGTPPRIDGRSIDYTKMEKQEGDKEPFQFSFSKVDLPKSQIPCWITHTSEKVHNTLKEGFDQSPMFNGRIRGLGPRYCPSIEDKINRFAEKKSHQLFIEPEGWNTVEIYVNGFSTSLPEEVQYKALKQIKGFENVKMFRPGYAIEYDFFPPTQLELSLQTRRVRGLFFAGQINGTTGYEEAACQGLMAGINAVRHIQDKEPVILDRSTSYIGVLIDDLINKGTKEPYRMFTSRAEFRVLLRQDNADIRLTPLSYEIGLACSDRYILCQKRKNKIEEIVDFIKSYKVKKDFINPFLEKQNTALLKESVKLDKLILRPQLDIEKMMDALPEVKNKIQSYDRTALMSAQIYIKYQGYIEKENELVNKMNRLENVKIPAHMKYKKLASLSSEAKEKLDKIKPKTIGQASRISGVSPSDISVLMVYMGR